ncbi:MAG: DUF1351 domain-containing protein [Clostridia bacterium]|nr:DUF1351 domain-containing protein [Clostridia bacterium]
MSQELALIMETPVEKLVPALLKWNNTELLEAVTETLKQYEGVTYTDKQISVAKADKAQLNAFIKALNDERIRIGKVYTAPLDKFKGEVDEVISKVKEVVSQISDQLDEYEIIRQQKKEAEIHAYFDSASGDFADLIPYERIRNPKWLNATAKQKVIEAEIDKIFEDARAAMAAIEALRSEDEPLIKAYYFRTLDLGAALMENDRLKQERIRVAELKARQEAEAQAKAEAAKIAAEERPQAEVAKETSEMPTSKIQAENAIPELIKLDFHIEATIEQLKALKAFLVENNIKYSKI